ncbi:glycosyltransferase, partial [Candidatus Marsarchaeota archaeon]|nr:glycosyltransferase [Candidatus Marsarchaeota archaeon]
MLNQKIVAIIVTYNPNIKRFKLVLESLKNQIYETIVVDNNSNNFKEVKKLMNTNVKLIHLNNNYGLAEGLNIGIKYTPKNVNWILTLDQDTIINKNVIKSLINEYEKLDKYIKSKVAIIHMAYENIGNRWIDKFIYNYIVLDKNHLNLMNNNIKFYLVKQVIQSGMLIKFNICTKFKFNKDLFIDQIDREYCSKIYNQGFLILDSKEILTKHKLGVTKIVNHKIIRYENKMRLKYFTR